MAEVCTWKTFKARVDEMLKEQGISEDTEIRWVDCGETPDAVDIDEDGKIMIY